MCTIQCTNRLIMIRPVNFEFDDDAFCKDNVFSDQEAARQGSVGKACLEFDALVLKLKSKGVIVDLFDAAGPSPDSGHAALTKFHKPQQSIDSLPPFLGLKVIVTSP